MDLFIFPIVPAPNFLPASFIHSISPLYFSSTNLLDLRLLLPPLIPSMSLSLSHILRDPRFTAVAPPLLSAWPLLYAKQVSARTRRTATTSQRRRQGLGGEKRTHTHTHTHTHMCTLVHTQLSHVVAVSFSVAAVCPLHLHAHALHTYVLPFFQSHMHEHTHKHTHTHTHTHTHSSRGLGWGWGHGELELSVCLSLVFQQEAPGPARHLSGAAAADKEEAINPRKITSTDTLSHRNTAMQPDSFHLQCRQRKKEGEEEPGELTLWMEKMARHREKKASFPFLTLVI